MSPILSAAGVSGDGNLLALAGMVPTYGTAAASFRTIVRAPPPDIPANGWPSARRRLSEALTVYAAPDQGVCSGDM